MKSIAMMNQNQLKAAGIILLTIGLGYYCLSSYLCQAMIDTGYFMSATRNDFAHLYVAGYLAERGGNFFEPRLMLYTHSYLHIPTGLNPFVYPPFFAMLLIPFSHFSYDGAWYLFSLLSQAAFFGAVAFLVRITRREEEPAVFWWGIYLALAACFFPIIKTYSAGQLNTFLLFAIAGGGYLLSQRRDTEAGIMLGFGAAIKIMPAFLIVYCFWKRRWSAVAAGIITIFVSVLISWIYLGPDVHYGFLSMARQMSYGTSTWSEFGQTFHLDPFNQSPSTLWYHLFTHGKTAQFGEINGVLDLPLIAKLASYLTTFAILGLLFWSTKRNPATFNHQEYAIWSIGMLLVPSLLWDHYLVQALLACAVALRLALDGQLKGIFGFALGILLMAIPFHHHLLLFRQGWMTVWMSIKLFGLLMVAGYLWIHRGDEIENRENGDFLPSHPGEEDRQIRASLLD